MLRTTSLTMLLLFLVVIGPAPADEDDDKDSASSHINSAKKSESLHPSEEYRDL